MDWQAYIPLAKLILHGFLFISGLVRIVQSRHQSLLLIPKTVNYYVKLTIVLAITVISASLCISNVNLEKKWQFGLDAAFFAFSGIVHHIEYTYSSISSTILLLYWLFIFSAQSLFAGTEFSKAQYHLTQDVYSLMVVALGIFVIFVLECIPKPTSLYQAVGEEENITPETSSNIFSRLTFTWMDSLMKLGRSKVLTMDDLWTLDTHDKTEYHSKNFENYLQQELQKKRYLILISPSLLRALAGAYGMQLLSSAVFKLFQDILQFTQPQLLNFMMVFASSFATDSSIEPYPFSFGIGIAFAMLGTAIIQTLFLHQYFQRTFILNMNVRSAITAQVYIKSLKLSNQSRQDSTVGEITNLMAVDAQKLGDLCNNLNLVWSGPLQIILAVVLLYRTLGPSVFGGIAFMVLMIPVSGILAKKSRELNRTQMSIKDNRTKLMDEVLSSMKVIKFNAWEEPFFERINSVRDEELGNLKRIWYFGSLTSLVWSATPFIVSFLTFAIYSATSEEPLTSTKVFVSLSLFQLLGFPLAVFPMVIAAVVEASVSFKRLLTFFLREEKDQNAVITEQLPSVGIVGDTAPVERVNIKDGVFAWQCTGGASIGPISCSVRDDELYAIVGAVGSGKSTLLSAVLGETYKRSGTVTVRGSIAYVPQSAWIMNATLRENIIFGRDFEEDLYQATLEACGLIPDLKSLIAGDRTEIGERGINLSGGQKQRVAIARAVYSQADIYILDDALSAVDAHVGKHIFEKVLGSKGMLRTKARLLVTHGIQYLSRCDQIMLLKDGTVGEVGNYKNLMDRKHLLWNLINEYGNHEEEQKVEESEPQPIEIKPKKVVTFADNATGQLTTSGSIIGAEESAQGKVQFAVYQAYAYACNYKYVSIFLVIAVFTQSLSIGQNVLLSFWSDFNDHHPAARANSPLPWLVAYGLIGLLVCSLTVLQLLFLYIFCAIKGSRLLHSQLLNNVLHLPQSFFDTTPLGRILNRFSKDIVTIDQVLPSCFLMYFRTLLMVTSVLVVNSIGNPYYLLLAFPLGILYNYVQKYYLSTSRELKRLDSVSKSPIYQNFQETLNGIVSIRAFQQQERFVKVNQEKVDSNLRAYYPSVSSNRWLAVRLEFIGSFIVFGSAIFGVLSLYKGNNISASLIGLMLVYAMGITQGLNWMVRQSCEIETNIVSVERIVEYSSVKTEAAFEIADADPGPDWPQQGSIAFNDYSARYRPGLDLVVHSLNFQVKPKEKIGVVGRTGAGKSSVTQALFRIFEPASGNIVIDGIDITKIGLKRLRSAISIIPQDPVLFNESVRYNLDPFGMHNDAEIWSALERVNLKHVIAAFPEGLLYTVSPNGENFSCGQRQLLCLARALIKSTKILIMDEATAAIDVETDAIIQKTIREELRDCTTITIAHRINTVMDSDKIMVLDEGKVAEFESPNILLANKKSKFFALAKEAGQTE